jgi:hypothetical protein
MAAPDFESATHLILMDDVDRRSPGGKRKLENLLSYGSHFPSARVRAIVLTNARDGSTMRKLHASLGAEAEDYMAVDGWKRLPICAVGTWVDNAIQSNSANLSHSMLSFLQDFVAWTLALDTRPVKDSLS